MTISCITKTCNELYYISWSYRSTSGDFETNLGTIFADNKEKKISKRLNHFSYDIDIELKDQQVDLIFHNVEENIVGNYFCKIGTHQTEPFCESHQKIVVFLEGNHN